MLKFAILNRVSRIVVDYDSMFYSIETKAFGTLRQESFGRPVGDHRANSTLILLTFLSETVLHIMFNMMQTSKSTAKIFISIFVKVRTPE